MWQSDVIMSDKQKLLERTWGYNMRRGDAVNQYFVHALWLVPDTILHETAE